MACVCVGKGFESFIITVAKRVRLIARNGKGSAVHGLCSWAFSSTERKR